MEHKIIFTGTTGAGKTTAIRAISEIEPVNTDVRNTDAEFDKAMTTASLDFGEIGLGNGDRLRLYGTPGQSRFDFMWDILARGALGVIVLVDNSRPAPLQDLDAYLAGFRTLVAQGACVVAVGRLAGHPRPSLDDYAAHLAASRVLCPVVEADVRNAAEVAQLVDLLLLQLESRAGADA